MFELLARRRFLPLFLTQFLGAVNDNVFKNALVIFIAFGGGLDDRRASMLVVLAGGVFILPFMLFSPLAGQLADRCDKDWLIRRIKLIEIAIMALGTVAFATGQLLALLALLFAMGLQSAAFGPLKYGILPQHLDAPELLPANALVQTATYLAILGGTMAGGLLVARGESGPLLVGVLTVVIAVTGWLTSRAIPPAPAGHPGLALDSNPLRGVARVLGEAWRARELFLLMIAVSWFWFLGAGCLSLVPGFTRAVLAGNEQVATLLLTAFSIGIGIGSLACAALAQRVGPLNLAVAGLLGMAACGLALGSVEPHGGEAVRGPLAVLGDPEARFAVLDLLLLAVAGGWYIVPLYTRLQRRAPVSARARVIATNNVLNALFMVLSALVTMSLLAANLGYGAVFAVLGVASLGMLPVMLAVRRVGSP